MDRGSPGRRVLAGDTGKLRRLPPDSAMLWLVCPKPSAPCTKTWDATTWNNFYLQLSLQFDIMLEAVQPASSSAQQIPGRNFNASRKLPFPSLIPLPQLFHMSWYTNVTSHWIACTILEPPDLLIPLWPHLAGSLGVICRFTGLLIPSPSWILAQSPRGRDCGPVQGRGRKWISACLFLSPSSRIHIEEIFPPFLSVYILNFKLNII